MWYLPLGLVLLYPLLFLESENLKTRKKMKYTKKILRILSNSWVQYFISQRLIITTRDMELRIHQGVHPANFHIFVTKFVVKKKLLHSGTDEVTLPHIVA
jgi:hypothetical protein